MIKRTSERHSAILDGYRQGDTNFNKWAETNLGCFALTKWSWGAITLDWDIDDRYIMPDGIMFGGHISAVADHVAGLTAMTVLEADGERFRTSKLETNFFRPIIKPKVVIEGRVINSSRSLIHVEGDFINPEGKLCVRIGAIQMRRASS